MNKGFQQIKIIIIVHNSLCSNNILRLKVFLNKFLKKEINMLIEQKSLKDL